MKSFFTIILLGIPSLLCLTSVDVGGVKGTDEVTIEYSSKGELNQKVKDLQKAVFEGDGPTMEELRQLSNAESDLKRKLFEARAEYGENSREAVTALHALGRNMYKRELFDRVFEISKQIVKIHEVLDGPEHVATANALSNVGSVAYKLKQTGYCDLIMNRALYIFLKEHGENSKEVTYITLCT